MSREHKWQGTDQKVPSQALSQKGMQHHDIEDRSNPPRQVQGLSTVPLARRAYTDWAIWDTLHHAVMHRAAASKPPLQMCGEAAAGRILRLQRDRS